MRRKGLGLVVVAAIAFAATPALAQDKKFDVNIGGGFTATTGEMHNHLGNGGNFMIGVTFHVNEHLGIQAEYGYTPVGSKRVPVPSFPLSRATRCRCRPGTTCIRGRSTPSADLARAMRRSVRTSSAAWASTTAWCS